jgi:serine/threonine protein kinase
MKHCPRCRRTYLDRQRFCLDDGALLSLRDPYHLVGRTLAEKYRLDALVGVGGMGAVYGAYHLALDRRVAFKILQPNLTLGHAHTLDLFEREARMAGRLVHENIVLVMDAGRTADDIAYIAMEWLEGRTLDEELAGRGPLDFTEAAEILRQVAAALDAAHAERIIHRDLKPANIMLMQQADGHERVKVLDFGIGKVLSETAGSPVSSVMGTPHYASPEQFQLRGRIDARTDIYSLGVLLFQMLTGALPFEATSVHELIHLHMTAAPPPLRQFRPEAPAALEQLINRMLAKDPDGRPAQAREIPALFASALDEMAGPAKAEAQPGRQQAREAHSLPALEETEWLPPPTGATANPQPPVINLEAEPPPVTRPEAGDIRQAEEPHVTPLPLPQLHSPRTDAENNRKRILYPVLGVVLVLAVSLPFMLQLISHTTPKVAQPVTEPGRQTQPEQGKSPDQTPALLINPPANQPAEGKAANPGLETPSPAGERAARTINGRWVINLNDTVLDSQTGLLWMKKDFRVLEGRFVRGWQEAMGWARKLNGQQYAGHNDWKVPSISEYKSIRDRAIYSKVFESQGEDCYWSRNEISAHVASYIYMRGEFGGAAVSGDKNEGTNKPGVLFNGNFSVRLVRQSK